MSLTRDELMISLRPKIASIDLSKSQSNAEFFQNNTLRPILKLQDALIKKLFYIKSKSPQLGTLDVLDQRKRISKILENNNILRNQLIGLIIGLMNQDEFEMYVEQEAEMKRRIKTMLVERLIQQ